MSLKIIENPGHPISYWNLSFGDRRYYPAKNHKEILAGVKCYLDEPHDKRICPFCKRGRGRV